MMRCLTALVNRLSQSQIHNSVHNHLNIKNVMKFSGLSLFPFTFFLGQSFHLHFYWSTVSIYIWAWQLCYRVGRPVLGLPNLEPLWCHKYSGLICYLFIVNDKKNKKKTIYLLLAQKLSIYLFLKYSCISFFFQ